MATFRAVVLDVATHADYNETVRVNVEIEWSAEEQQHPDMVYTLRGYLVEKEDGLDHYQLTAYGELQRIQRIGDADDRIMSQPDIWRPFREIAISPKNGSHFELTERFNVGAYTNHGGKENLVAIVTVVAKRGPVQAARSDMGISNQVDIQVNP